MSDKANYFLSKALGDDFFESLAKVELWKPGTKTTVDHEEIKTGLHIVPRAVMSFLFRELIPMQINDSKEIAIPVGPDCLIRVTKHERDVYSGDITEANRVIVDFKYRSVPGIGLIIMSAFELYDLDQLKVPEKVAEVPGHADDFSARVQKLIDDRMQLQGLVERVVEHKMAQKDAVQQLLMARITSGLVHDEPSMPEAPIEKSVEKSKKGSPLKDFLDRKKPKKEEFSIHMAKGEQVDCPDCHKNIFNGKIFSGCICLGNDREKKLFIKKTEEGIKVRFSQGWDRENIEMLLEVLRRKHE